MNQREIKLDLGLKWELHEIDIQFINKSLFIIIWLQYLISFHNYSLNFTPGYKHEIVWMIKRCHHIETSTTFRKYPKVNIII